MEGCKDCEKYRAVLADTPENVEAIVASWRQGMMDTQHEIVRGVLAALRARAGQL